MNDHQLARADRDVIRAYDQQLARHRRKEPGFVWDHELERRAHAVLGRQEAEREEKRRNRGSWLLLIFVSMPVLIVSLIIIGPWLAGLSPVVLLVLYLIAKDAQK